MVKIKYICERLKTLDWEEMRKKLDSIHQKTGKSRIEILIDMQKCALKYGAGYMDYDLFEMYNLTPRQRNTYITRGRNNEFVIKYCDKDYLHYFMNKDEFNQKFNQYLKRDWIKVGSQNKEDVIEFMKRHSTFMMKPINGGCGHGIEKINTEDYPSLEDIYQYIRKKEIEFELEEVLKQHLEVAKIYPDSINTVRVVTIVTTAKGKSILTIPKERRKELRLVPHVICTYFRIGNGKFVDNFNSGGMVAPVDENTGIVSQVAIDKQKRVYTTHPQTGNAIKGFQFPDWKRAIEMCKEASMVIPEMGYVGWDVCFTPEGPVLVEANEFPGHDIYQLPEHTPDKIGMMPKFKGIR